MATSQVDVEKRFGMVSMLFIIVKRVYSRLWGELLKILSKVNVEYNENDISKHAVGCQLF